MEVSERLWAALVSDGYAVLVGVASFFRPVLLIPKHNPVPVNELGHGTLVAVWLPDNDSHELAALVVSFRILLPVLVVPN